MSSSSSPLPDDLTAIIDGVDAVDREVWALVSPLSEAQFNWQPRGGKAWSIGQCLDHLNVTNTGYVASLIDGGTRARAAGSTRRGALKLSLIGGYVVRSMEPPPRIRMRHTNKMAPASTTQKRAVCSRFWMLNDQLRGVVREFADIDMNRATLANPVISALRMKFTTALLLVCAHNRRHVYQAQRVREAEDFPTEAAVPMLQPS